MYRKEKPLEADALTADITKFQTENKSVWVETYCVFDKVAGDWNKSVAAELRLEKDRIRSTMSRESPRAAEEGTETPQKAGADLLGADIGWGLHDGDSYSDIEAEKEKKTVPPPAPPLGVGGTTDLKDNVVDNRQSSSLSPSSNPGLSPGSVCQRIREVADGGDRVVRGIQL